MGRDARSNPFAGWKKTEGVTIRDAYDQYGRPIGVGDFVMLSQMGGIVWRVVETKPIMDPKAPPGLVGMTMVATTMLSEPGGVPLQGVVKVRDVSEYLTPEQLEQLEQARAQAQGPSGLVVP
jgi:hypothetical protein